jgi:CheY-like chemotaxis protein
MTHGPVLIVDDEPSNLAILRGILRDEYRLMFARSGADALSLAIEHQPAVLLLAYSAESGHRFRRETGHRFRTKVATGSGPGGQGLR